MEIWPLLVPPRWKLGALCYARARALGLPEATPPRKFPADHTPVTIRTHQLRSSPGVSTGLRRAETASTAGPTGSPLPTQRQARQARRVIRGTPETFDRAGDPTHEDRPPEGSRPALLARRSPAPCSPDDRPGSLTLHPRAWSTGGCCSPAARQTCGRPGGASWRQDHAGQPQRSIGRPPTRRSPARSSRLRTHHPDHPDHQSCSTHPSSSTATHPPGSPTQPCPAPLAPQHERRPSRPRGWRRGDDAAAVMSSDPAVLARPAARRAEGQAVEGSCQPDSGASPDSGGVAGQRGRRGRGTCGQAAAPPLERPPSPSPRDSTTARPAPTTPACATD